jgi:two-component system, LuxR family, sensor kinase FixL
MALCHGPDDEVLALVQRIADAESALEGLVGKVDVVLDPATAAPIMLRQAQGELLQSEERFRSAFEHAAIGMAVTTPDYTWLRVNQCLCDMLGYSEAELLANTAESVTDPRDWVAEQSLVAELLCGRTSHYRLEKRFVHKRGHVIWTRLSVSLVRDRHGKALYLLPQVEDISERRQAEAASQRYLRRLEALNRQLAESERKYRSLFENSLDAICRIGPDGRFIDGNPALLVMLGLPDPKSLQTVRVQDFWPAEAEDLAPIGPAKLLPSCISRPDGTRVWIEARVQPIPDANGRLLYYDAILRDVTDRKLAEERARDRQEQLSHVARIATIGEMAAMLAHDLNQPLGAIVNYTKGCVRRMRSDSCPSDPLVEAMEQAAAEATRAADIVSRLRRLVDRRCQECRTDINLLVREAVGLLGTELQRHQVTARLYLKEELPPVCVDPVQIEQVLLNLARNAIESMDRRGTPRVLTLQSTVTAAKRIEVSVSDTGVGLSRNDARLMFDAFFSTKEGGIGLGLCISRSIIESHGGQLWGMSNPERGATFRFTLPLADQPARVIHHLS